MKQDRILGLDIGSSSVRGALFDRGGRIVGRSFFQKDRGMTHSRDGGAEFAPEAAVKQLGKVLDGVLGAKQPNATVTHIASCSYWHSLIGVDKTGKPTTPILMWNDNRSRRFVQTLREAFRETTVHSRTGARFHTSYWPAKLLWIREEHPDIWNGTETWMSFADFAALRLFGGAPASISMASGSGMFDIRKRKWDKPLMDFLGIDEGKLPVIEGPTIALPRPKTRGKKRWPALADAVWVSTIGDGAANNLGSGCTDQDRAALMIGTSAAVRVLYAGEPPTKLPSGLFCYRLDEKRVIIGGAVSDGGGLYNWVKETMRYDINERQLERHFDKLGLGGHGLTLEPFLSGERSLAYNEHAVGSITGLTIAHGPSDIMLAAMEAVAYRLKAIVDQLGELFPLEEIRISGGALRESAVWRKIVSQVLESDLAKVKEREAALIGAVLYALERYGKKT